MEDTIIISVLSFASRCSHFKMYIATFRLLTACLQAMRSTGYAAPFISRWSAVIGAFRSPLVEFICMFSGEFIFYILYCHLEA